MTPTTTYLSQPQTNQHQKTTVPDLLQSASLLINSLQEHKKSKKAPIHTTTKTKPKPKETKDATY